MKPEVYILIGMLLIAMLSTAAMTLLAVKVIGVKELGTLGLVLPVFTMMTTAFAGLLGMIMQKVLQESKEEKPKPKKRKKPTPKAIS